MRERETAIPEAERRAPFSARGGPRFAAGLAWRCTLLGLLAGSLGLGFVKLDVAHAHAPTPRRAQQRDEPEDVPAVDPYTQGRPERMLAAGYVRFGPFGWGDGHDTNAILQVLGDIPLLWVETAHFRIGSSLSKYTVAADPRERAKVKAELKVLKGRLVGIRGNERELDRWLRLHLYAYRLEELYAAFCARFGLPGDDLPGDDLPGDDLPGDPVGGTYLGRPEKFRVLLCDKESGLARYTGRFLGNEQRASMRGVFHELDAMYFCLARESLQGTYDNDTALHCVLADGVAALLLDGLERFVHPAPPWLAHGVGQLFAREVDVRFPTVPPGSNASGDDDWYQWEPRVFGRVRHDYYPRWEELFAWPDFEPIDSTQLMLAWSHVEFLAQEPDPLRRLALAIKAAQDYGEQATPEEQRAALEGATGRSLAQLEEAWVQHVLDDYDRK